MKSTKSRRLAAITLLALFIGDICFPTVSWALTGGPSQPELASFEPMGTNQMVDVFSGDFTYNIPLMNVPGPNGGYPINLHYHAAPNVEDEASWVGLGWNINVGSINRMVRGVPDDFSGELVRRVKSQKPNISANFSYRNPGSEGFLDVPTTETEVYGFSDVFDGLPSATLSYDTYQGFSFQAKLGLSKAISAQLAPDAYKSIVELGDKIKDKKNEFLNSITEKIIRIDPKKVKDIKKGPFEKAILQIGATNVSSTISKLSLKSIKRYGLAINFPSD